MESQNYREFTLTIVIATSLFHRGENYGLFLHDLPKVTHSGTGPSLLV